ncbi:MAG: DUF58 domain-containing protein [Candidatus Lokiarchaeota archaeon]|nr:DUF58 domain-containing protein [Candidatus Lokiarchaeota archaeon]
MITERCKSLITFGMILLFLGFVINNFYFIIIGIFLLLGAVIDIPIFEASIDANKDLQLERFYDKDKVFVNDFLQVSIKIKNIGNKNYNFIEVFDVFPTEAFTLVLGENWIGTRLDAKSEITFSYILQAKLRGAYNLGPAQLVVRDRLGLHFETAGLPVVTECLVYPDYQDIKRMEAFASKRRQGILYGVHSSRMKGLGSDFYGIRDYETSDEFRRIDWKASAKKENKFLIREYESEKNIRILILLDVSKTMTRGKFEIDKLEYSIRASILLSNLALERRDNVGLMMFSDRLHYFLEPSASNRQIYYIMDHLAKAQAKGKKVLKEAMDYAVKRISKASFFFLITDMEDVKDEFIEALKIARSYKHQVIVISPFGPWFEGRPEELSDVDKALSSAISEELWEKRSELKQKMRNLGINCIDVGPDDFFPIVINEYQKAKRAGKGLM